MKPPAPIPITYNRPFVYSYQKKILDSPARFTVCQAATKVGKTASHIIWLFEQALQCSSDPSNKIMTVGEDGRLKVEIKSKGDELKNKSVWWVAPTNGQAKIAYDRMKVQIGVKSVDNDKEEDVNNNQFIKCHDTNKIITLGTGVKIEFKTAEKPDNLYGDDVYAFVFDEFTRAREEAWFALRTTITSTGGKGKFIGNVKGKKNWGYKLSMKAKSGDDPKFEYHKITAYEAAAEGMTTKDGTPFIEEIEAAKKDLPESVFKELYLAEASEDGSNPFGMQHISQCTHPMSTQPPICFGIDLAKSVDWTVPIGLDRFGSVSYLDRYQKDWRTTVLDIKALPDVPTNIDSTGVGDPIVEQVQQGRGNVFGKKFTQASKQQLMEGLSLAIQQKKIAFPEGIIKDELESFEYEYTRTGVKYSAPEGMTDDCVCALALAWELYPTASASGQYSWS